MQQPAVILLGEDEEDYVLLLRKAFSEANVGNPLQVVSTGQEVIAYLKGEGKYASRDEYPLPDLLLLDIKLPGYTGLEIIDWARSQPGLAGLRIIVLTSSEQLRDVNDAYRLGANSFLLKPYDFSDLVYLSKMIKEFWLGLSKCPESYRPPKKQDITAKTAGVYAVDGGKNSDPAPQPGVRLSNDSNPLILIVEDNPLNAQLAIDILEASGVRVRWAENAEAGIQMAREFLPDLILMDLSLPGMDGLSATKMLKADPATRHLRVIGFTAHAPGDEKLGLGLVIGFDGYLSKPIDTRTFADSVKSFVMQKEDFRS